MKFVLFYKKCPCSSKFQRPWTLLKNKKKTKIFQIIFAASSHSHVATPTTYSRFWIRHMNRFDRLMLAPSILISWNRVCEHGSNAISWNRACSRGLKTNRLHFPSFIHYYLSPIYFAPTNSGVFDSPLTWA